MSCEHGNHVAACDICDAIDAAYKSGYVAGGIAALATKTPEASGADYVMVPRDLRTEGDMYEAGIRARNEGRSVAEMWGLILAAAPLNPAPPTGGTKPAECADGCPPFQVCDYCQYGQPTPADESGADAELRWVIAGEIYGRPTGPDALEYANNNWNPDSVLDARIYLLDNIKAVYTPAAEPSAAAQEDRNALADMVQATTGCGRINAHRIVKQIADRLQPSGAGEDAARYEELIYAVARKFPGESRHETALRYIREREAAANENGAARRARGEANG